MKTKKQTLGQWFRSLFIKNKLQQDAPKVEITEEEIVNDPFKTEASKKDYTINEMPLINTKKEFTNSKSFLVRIEDKTHDLTEKQFVFYSIIKDLQQVFDQGVNGKIIMLNFYSTIYPDLTHSEIEKKIPKSKLHFTNYGGTTKYLYKSGLLIRVKKNQYKVKF
jgi:hypothetical protein